MLDTAEKKWAPPDDPVFQLVPPSFEPYVNQCFEELGKPKVDIESFWDVYHELWDLVEVTVPGDVVVTLNERTVDDGDNVPEPFTFGHMKEPVLGGTPIPEDDEDEGGRGENGEGGEDEGEGGDDGGEILCVEFTNEEERDQLS